MQIISLSGLDGSGKSTQIELLKDYLKSKDKTFFYFHGARSSVSSLYKTLPIFSWRKTKEKVKKDQGITRANWVEIQLRKIALGIDICRFRKLLKKVNVDYIISDRYFYDSVVNIEYLNHRHRMSRMLAEKFIPKPDFAFYISVKPETIMRRERKPDQGINYLVAKEKLFKNKIKDWDIIVLNGEKGKNDIFSEIKSKINV